MNSIGRLYKVEIFGESHGIGVGILIDGIPAGINISSEEFENDLKRRMPKIEGTTNRSDTLLPKIISGEYQGKTTGSPMLLLFENNDIQSKDYKNLIKTPRPGHSDFVAIKKYNSFHNPNGGGHFSGRLTAGIVAAGVIAKKILNKVEIDARILSIHGSADIDKEIEKAIAKKDSVGGIVECTIKGLEIGIGEPFFDSIESCISHIVFSIPGVKGIEFGSGFSAADMYGSEHNDILISNDGVTKTNNSGGISGGISNGNNIIFRVAIKPTSSIPKQQETINVSTGQKDTIVIKGRHDACIALRVPVIIEAAAAIVLADLKLIRQSQIV